MSYLRFTDGININTDGPFRIIHRKDGYYVVKMAVASRSIIGRTVNKLLLK